MSKQRMFDIAIKTRKTSKCEKRHFAYIQHKSPPLCIIPIELKYQDSERQIYLTEITIYAK